MIYTVLTYDVNSKRTDKIAKIAKKYLSPVQRSVYEGFITDKKLSALKAELAKAIIPEEDHIMIYSGKNGILPEKQEIGKKPEELEYLI